MSPAPTSTATGSVEPGLVDSDGGFWLWEPRQSTNKNRQENTFKGRMSLAIPIRDSILLG